MLGDEESHFVLIRTVGQWTDQVRDNQEKLQAAGWAEGTPLRSAVHLDYEAFCLMVEALVALEPYTGRPVSQELRDMAQIRPIGEVLGG